MSFAVGHPKFGGRRKGSRNQLSAALIAELCADFRKHGKAAVMAVREGRPADYLKICALLVAKMEDNAAAQPTQINVITGVRDAASGEVRYGPGEYWNPPANRPLLRDGRDPFEEHGAKPTPQSARPVTGTHSNSPGNLGLGRFPRTSSIRWLAGPMGAGCSRRCLSPKFCASRMAPSCQNRR
jgi:hypothetical protein